MNLRDSTYVCVHVCVYVRVYVCVCVCVRGRNNMRTLDMSSLFSIETGLCVLNFIPTLHISMISVVLITIELLFTLKTETNPLLEIHHIMWRRSHITSWRGNFSLILHVGYPSYCIYTWTVFVDGMHAKCADNSSWLLHATILDTVLWMGVRETYSGGSGKVHLKMVWRSRD